MRYLSLTHADPTRLKKLSAVIIFQRPDYHPLPLVKYFFYNSFFHCLVMSYDSLFFILGCCRLRFLPLKVSSCMTKLLLTQIPFSTLPPLSPLGWNQIAIDCSSTSLERISLIRFSPFHLSPLSPPPLLPLYHSRSMIRQNIPKLPRCKIVSSQ